MTQDYYKSLCKNNTHNRFYTYLHRRNDNGEVFYVGKGSGVRAWSVQGRSCKWREVVNTYGCSVEIYKDHLLDEESLDLERDLIQHFGGLNGLVNLTTGGQGTSVSDEVRQKMSLSHMGKKAPKEVIDKVISKWTPEKRKEFSESRTGSNATRFDKSVYVFFHNLSEIVHIGTRVSLCEKYNIKSSLLKGLFSKKRKKRNTVKGWSVV